MTGKKLCLAAALLLGLGGLASAGEEKIGIDAVPQNVKDAALAAVPGLAIEAAAREVKKDVVEYEIQGKAGGVAYEIDIRSDGKVLEVEKGGAKDDDDDDDDDDDENDD
jgi:hypothetical protein